MKTIFRYTNLAILIAAILAFGTATSFAQSPTPAATGPCDDTAGLNALDTKIRDLLQKTDLESRKTKIDSAKQYLEKYSTCEPAKEFATYLTPLIPKWEESYRKALDAKEAETRYKRFDTAVQAKNWDDVYAVGKEILAKEPEQVDLMITLGSIGYDELYAGRTTFKYNDDTIKYAKQAIAALESGKTAKTHGLFAWSFKTKERALAELNLTIGYLTQIAQKNKKDAAPYFFKATQNTTETAKNSIPYALIGDYYFEELDKLTGEIKSMAANQLGTDTEEVAKQKVDAIKAKVALSNGMAERAMDAFSRAYQFASAATPVGKTYKEQMKKNVANAYNLRFGKTEGVDAWIASTVTKPFVNPTTPVAPISDPEPTTTPAASTTTAPTSTTPAAPVKPVPTTTKPVTTTTKPAASPAATTSKPQAKAKKPVAKKRTT
ncbi:MAG: hypothetical protein ACKVRN_12950 [Pyrinomonadaceae bacterium]